MKNKPKHRVTLEELSQEINVSRTTIYKVLNNKGEVSEKTRSIVLDAIQEYQYTPNKAAKNLARNRSYNMAFVGFHSPQAPYTQSNLLEGIQWAAQELSDYGLNIEYYPGQSAAQTEILYRLAEQDTDGFIIYPELLEPLRGCVNELTAAGKMVFTVNRDIPDCSRQAYIGCNYYNSGILAAEVLARMVPAGKDIAVLLGGEGPEHTDIQQRYRGLIKKMERFPEIGLKKPYLCNPSSPQELEQYVTHILGKEENTGGILDMTYQLDLVGTTVYKCGNKARLVGFDLCDTVRNHMIAHSIDAVIFQDTFHQGYMAAKYLFLSLENNRLVPIPERVSKLEVVYEGNLEFYL